MSIALLLAIAAITVGSRVVALAALPQLDGAAGGLIERLPAPLFAALAALSVVGSGDVTDPALLTAVIGALLSTPWRSLLITLVAGFGGYLLATLIW